MASLTHVCMWTNNGWARITAEQAAALHPGGTVSANRGLFMCELCGQYVTLTDGDVRVRYFRHSAYEKSKDCPERTFGSGVQVTYDSKEHDLPIKISKIKFNSFKLEIGFVRVPSNLLSRKAKIKIIPSNTRLTPFTYLAERINADGITYLSIGDTPSPEYSISISEGSDALTHFWPKKVPGIDYSGSVFDKESGKKLSYDADIVVGKSYYLLVKGMISIPRNRAHVFVKEVCESRTTNGTWRIYEVKALDFDETSAKFFLAYHCRLTETPVNIQPLWPVYVQAPYIIKHNKDNVILHVKGNADTHVFPFTRLSSKFFGSSHIVEVGCNSRQQLISAGRARALQYLYFWKEELSDGHGAQAIVSDCHGQLLNPGILNQLPDGKRIQIRLEYDGEAIIREHNEIIEVRDIKANNVSEIDNLHFGTIVNITIGLDSVWEGTFAKVQQINETNEDELLKIIMEAGGVQVPVSHTLGNMSYALSNYPRIRAWLYTVIRKGSASDKSLKLLRLLVSQIKTGTDVNLGGKK